jgi:hypothetical protein
MILICRSVIPATSAAVKYFVFGAVGMPGENF